MERVALVTGGTGFVGSNLCRKLVQVGWTVHIIAIPNDNYSLLNDIKERITIHIHDERPSCMDSIMANTKPDIVFHLASLFLSQHTSNDIERLIVSNVLFGTQLLDAMTAQGITKIVNTGTSWQHYENKPYSPVNLYAATKQAFEDIMQYYVEVERISAITLKLFDTYGPGDPRPKLMNLLLNTAHTGQLLLMSPGAQFIDLVHVDDVVNAYLMASDYLYMRANCGHDVFAVTTGQFVSLKNFVALFEKAAHKKLNIKWDARPYRSREVMNPWEEGKCLPGWQPSVSLKDGVAELIDMFRKKEECDF